MSESCTNKRQDAETQNWPNVVNTAELSVITNPTAMGNNNNENSFLSESINKDIKVFFQGWYLMRINVLFQSN